MSQPKAKCTKEYINKFFNQTWKKGEDVTVVKIEGKNTTITSAKGGKFSILTSTFNEHFKYI